MSYYPILEAPGCEGWTTLCNFAPNNWESTRTRKRHVNLTWRQGHRWQSHSLGILGPGETRTVRRSHVASLVPDGELALLSLGAVGGDACDSLPLVDLATTVVPSWRATLGLSSLEACTSYQGEVDPFPVPGSLLTFGPLMQFGKGVLNYLLFINLERSADVRTSRVEIYDAANTDLRGAFEVRNNAVTCIPLDHAGLTASELPLIICRDMGAIPLYFSKTADGAHLSLEHTHPPGSYVIHGRRWDAQKVLKQHWFAKARP